MGVLKEKGKGGGDCVSIHRFPPLYCTYASLLVQFIDDLVCSP